MNDFDIPRAAYIALLQREAIVTVAYSDDTTGGGKWSQGAGSQWNYNLSRAVKGDDPPITIEEAVVWTKAGVASRLETIRGILKVEITPDQMGSVHSLYFQHGSAPLNRVVSLFNAGKPFAAMLAFSEFASGQNGVQTEGHSKRRALEIAAGYGLYPADSQIPVYEGNPRDPNTQRHFVDGTTLNL